MKNWETIFEGNFCIGVGIRTAETFDGHSLSTVEMVCNSILPDTDEGYEKERDEIVRNMNLIAQAPMMLETLKEIAKGQGRYDTDRLQHCANTVTDMVNLAKEAINKVETF